MASGAGSGPDSGEGLSPAGGRRPSTTRRRRRVHVERRDGYNLVVGGPVPKQADAITVGKTVVVRRQFEANERLLAHELVHVRQYRELGAVRFLIRYVGSYLRFRLRGHRHLAAYRRIPLEVEAAWASRHALIGRRGDRVGPVDTDSPRPRAPRQRLFS